jgi:pyrroloquinoline quinone (PQQ) biosynthesis protein C
MSETMTLSESEKGPRMRHSVVDWLEENTAELLRDIQQQDFWKFIMSPDADPKAVVALMRQVYLEIVGYQPDVIEAAIASIAQFPRSMKPRLVKAMLAHQGDEFDHGEMALRDFVGLGGSEAAARSARMSPEAFAVAGVWWMIARRRNPFAYLGALYLFEGLTPTVTGLVKEKLMAKGFTEKSLEYVEFHSTEDVKHANLVHYMISEVANIYPEATESIKYGFECFRAVYPIPIWRAAFERARASVNKQEVS